MTSFADLGLSHEALKAVSALGYSEPTPVQEQACPLVLQRHDVVAAAKTGTGKTAAFSLPALDLLANEPRAAAKHPHMLVVTPTRELAMQIEEVCSTIARFTSHRIGCVVGGVGFEPQVQRLAKGVDVLIATPGRLLDLMGQKAVDLSQVSILVLDEADRMLDMGFLPSVTKIVNATPKSRQTLLFSATLDKSVMSQVSSLLRDPKMVQIAAKGETADTVEQYVAEVPHTLKPALLIALLKERGSKRVIVFARTRHRADAACRKLKRAGFVAEAIHSDRSQNQRKRALDHFAAGETDVLVATDVLARGIDVDEVAYVVNYDLPTQPEDYVHRIGRTGRAGAAGFAVSFVSPESTQDLQAIEKFIKKSIPTITVSGFDLEQAAAEAAQRATQAAARKDPELAEAARELAKKQRKKSKRSKARAASASTPAQSATTAPAAPRASVQADAQAETQQHAHTRKGGESAKRSGEVTEARAHTSKPARARKNAKQRRAPVPARASAQAMPAHAKNSAQKSAAPTRDMRPGRAHRQALAQRRGNR